GCTPRTLRRPAPNAHARQAKIVPRRQGQRTHRRLHSYEVSRRGVVGRGARQGCAEGPAPPRGDHLPREGTRCSGDHAEGATDGAPLRLLVRRHRAGSGASGFRDGKGSPFIPGLEGGEGGASDLRGADCRSTKVAGGPKSEPSAG